MFKLRLIAFICMSSGMFFASCKTKSKDSNVERALLDVLSKFPQLPKAGIIGSKTYRLTRSIHIGENGVEIQLRSCSDTVGDPQKIIVVINKLNQTYAVPLLSNTYHDYWGFEFDSLITSVKPINTTFEKELDNCLKQLNIYDTLRTAGVVIEEMLLSVLQCERIVESDSVLQQKTIYLTNNYNLPYEDSDSCLKRLKQNWEEIKKIFHPSVNVRTASAFFDKVNKRIYQLDFRFLRNTGKLRIKTYRLDCTYHMSIL